MVDGRPSLDEARRKVFETCKKRPCPEPSPGRRPLEM